jgi:D-alanyl-D-alanine dipeptidase
MSKNKLLAIATTLICGMTMVSCFSDTKKSTAVSATDNTSQFVTITDIVPDVILEIRYFGTYNFVGTRIDSYEAPIALLTKQAADSLKAVSDDVKAQGYRIKIYDAYRLRRRVLTISYAGQRI